MGEECEHVESSGTHEWFPSGTYEVHSVSYSDGKFEALVNATVRCRYCEEMHELCFTGEDEVEL